MPRWGILAALAAAVVASASCSGRDTGPAPSPVPASTPGSWVPIATNDSIQAAVDSHAAGTTFVLAAGTHRISASITPKTGDTFIGEDGAVLDGTGWSSTDVNDAAFRAHNQDIDNVTIRNLTIQHMPQDGIHAFVDYSDGWTVDHVEITAVGHEAIHLGNSSTLRASTIHDNPFSGYSAYKATSVLFEGNEFARNGNESKICGGHGVTFRNNYVHDNATNGIWYDCASVDGLVEDNRVEDNGGQGIFYEISAQGVIRNNSIARSGGAAIFVSTSKQVEVYGNTLTNNYRGVELFLTCAAIGQGPIGYDLAHDSVHDNTVTVDTTSGAFGNGLSYVSSCTPGQYGPYVHQQKDLTFQGNRYRVPSTTGPYWLWGFGHLVTWTDWQVLPQDATGTLQ